MVIIDLLRHDIDIYIIIGSDVITHFFNKPSNLILKPQLQLIATSFIERIQITLILNILMKLQPFY